LSLRAFCVARVHVEAVPQTIDAHGAALRCRRRPD
jgi:hypothetical protein